MLDTEDTKDNLGQEVSLRNSKSITVAFKLNGKNYPLWSKLINVKIGGRGAYPYIRNDPPEPGSKGFDEWEENDLVVFSWIVDNIENNIIADFAHHQTSKALWDSLAVMFENRADPYLIYDLEEKAINIKQGSLDLETYYRKIQGLWIDLSSPLKFSTNIHVVEMTAYGAVVSLRNTINNFLNCSRLSIAGRSQQIIQVVINELQPWQEILERLDKTSPSRSRKKVNALDGRIKEAIWKFEGSLESLLTQQIPSQLETLPEVVFIDLQSLQNEAHSFFQMLKHMKKDYIYEVENMPQDEPISSSIGFHGANSKMIGLSD